MTAPSSFTFRGEQCAPTVILVSRLLFLKCSWFCYIRRVPVLHIRIYRLWYTYARRSRVSFRAEVIGQLINNQPKEWYLAGLISHLLKQFWYSITQFRHFPVKYGKSSLVPASQMLGFASFIFIIGDSKLNIFGYQTAVLTYEVIWIWYSLFLDII